RALSFCRRSANTPYPAATNPRIPRADTKIPNSDCTSPMSSPSGAGPAPAQRQLEVLQTAYPCLVGVGGSAEPTDFLVDDEVLVGEPGVQVVAGQPRVALDAFRVVLHVVDGALQRDPVGGERGHDQQQGGGHEPEYGNVRPLCPVHNLTP